MSRPAMLMAWVALAACDTEKPPAPPTWAVIEEELGGALLSVGGPDDGSSLHAVGADPGGGPLWLVREGEGGWRTLDTSATPGDLWWVHPTSGGPVYAVGDNGRVLRLEPDAGAPTAMDTSAIDPAATLFGVWQAPTGEAWAVGGDASPSNGPGLVAVLSGTVWTPVHELPAEVSPTALFFKVWGRSASEVWVVGEEGTVLRYDGQGWTLEVLAGKPRLVTVHGDDSRLVAVGGTNQAVIAELGTGGWTIQEPELVPGLNGVRLGRGRAVAVCGVGTVLFEEPRGTWSVGPEVPTFEGLHASWIAPDGRVYAVGGDLVGLTRGVLLSYGP
jgi:hypothetical protein